MTLDRQQRAIGFVALIFTVLVCIAAKPIAVPLILGTWVGTLAAPVNDRLGRALGGRARSGGLLTAVLLLLLLGLFALLYTTLGQAAIGLFDELAGAKGIQGALEALVTESKQQPDPQRLMAFAKEHGGEAQTLAKAVGLLGLGTLFFLFFLGLATFGTFAGGRELYGWLRDRSPLSPAQSDRMAAAYTETGRGLYVSIGLTCLTQGVLCTGMFLVLGVPRAFLLGFLCSMFAILPLVGTPLVWIPVAIGLHLIGENGKMAAVLAFGGGVIGAVEFFIGPAFAKLGKLRLPSEIVLVAMFGGALGLGPAGLILGPLVFRLAKEGLDLSREAKVVGEGPAVQRP